MNVFLLGAPRNGFEIYPPNPLLRQYDKNSKSVYEVFIENNAAHYVYMVYGLYTYEGGRPGSNFGICVKVQDGFIPDILAVKEQLENLYINLLKSKKLILMVKPDTIVFKMDSFASGDSGESRRVSNYLIEVIQNTFESEFRATITPLSNLWELSTTDKNLNNLRTEKWISMDLNALVRKPTASVIQELNQTIHKLLDSIATTKGALEQLLAISKLEELISNIPINTAQDDELKALSETCKKGMERVKALGDTLLQNSKIHHRLSDISKKLETIQMDIAKQQKTSKLSILQRLALWCALLLLLGQSVLIYILYTHKFTQQMPARSIPNKQDKEKSTEGSKKTMATWSIIKGGIPTNVQKLMVVNLPKEKTAKKVLQLAASEWKATHRLLLIFATPQQLSTSAIALRPQDTTNTAIIYITASASDSSTAVTFLDKKPNSYWAADENLAKSYSLEIADYIQAVLLLKTQGAADKALYTVAFQGKLDDLKIHWNQSGVLQPNIEK